MNDATVNLKFKILQKPVYMSKVRRDSTKCLEPLDSFVRSLVPARTDIRLWLKPSIQCAAVTKKFSFSMEPPQKSILLKEMNEQFVNKLSLELTGEIWCWLLKEKQTPASPSCLHLKWHLIRIMYWRCFTTNNSWVAIATGFLTRRFYRIPTKKVAEDPGITVHECCKCHENWKF